MSWKKVLSLVLALAMMFSLATPVYALESAADDLDNGEKAWLASIAVALRAVDAELVDCALAGGGELHSMNAEGRLQRVRAESGVLALHEEYARGKGSAEQETGSGRSDGEAKP